MKKLFACSLIALALSLPRTAAKAQFNTFDTHGVVALATNAAVTATVTNTGRDMFGYTGQDIAVLNWSQSAGTNATLDVRLQSSTALASGYADVYGAAYDQITNAIPGSSGILTMRFDPNAASRYVRVIQTVGGSDSPAFSTSVNFIGRRKYN